MKSKNLYLTKIILHQPISHLPLPPLKQLAAILLIIAFASQTFYNGFVMLDYYSNTKAYAKNCENKARPKMHCNGHCQLMKKMQEQEKKEAQVPERKFEKQTETISSKSFFATLTQRDFSLISNSKNIIFKTGNPVSKSFDFFHPPKSLFS